jgi:hypothetical protein
MISDLQKQLEGLKSNIPYCDKLQPAVSSSNIGWHIEHSLLTIDKIIDRLSQTNSNDYKWKFSLLRIFVFTTSTIPKGRAQAPKIVQPTADLSSESLSQHWSSTSEKIGSLSGIDPRQYFEHPYFGHLKLKPAIRFLAIHTLHHFKIIRNIKA